MHALVLAAGLGTRLRPLTDVRAKPALPVAGQAMIRRIIAWLVTHGVGDVVVNLHYRPQTLAAVLGDGSDLGVHLRYSWEQPQVLGSAGGPRHALDLLGHEPFIVVNGDTLTDVDLGRLSGAHRASGALVTLALVPNREPHRYGGVRLDEQRRYLGVVPRGDAADGSYHFVGAQVASPAAFRSLADNEPLKSLGGVYDALAAAEPGAIRGFVTEAGFWDIGTVSDYLATASAFAGADGAPPDPRLPHSSVPAGARLQLSPSAVVRNSIIWDDVQINDHAVLDRCIVTDRVVVPASSSYQDAILIASDGAQPLALPLDTPHV